jgi:hypothetical protein
MFFVPGKHRYDMLLAFLLSSYAYIVSAESYWLGRSSQIWNTLDIPRVCKVSRDGVSTSSFPLTHSPTCVQTPISNGTSNVQKDFCVYTNSLFSDGRGISFITTPAVFADIIAETYYDEEYRDETREQIYAEHPTDNRGNGLIANQAIVAGTTIMVKTPVLLIAREVLEGTPRETRFALLEQAVNQLPVKTQELLLNLAKSRGGNDTNDVVQTNSMRVELGDVKHLGIIPEAAVSQCLHVFHIICIANRCIENQPCLSSEVGYLQARAAQS